MPPHAPGPPLGIHALSDDLLAQVFEGVELADRHRLLALCCRQWHRLACTSPELLRSVSALISAPDAPTFLRRVRSLCNWLVRWAAPHMAQLRLQLSAPSDGAKWGEEDGEMFRLEFTTTLVATLVACGTHGRLTELCLELGGDCSLHLGSWMAPLASLRRLTATLDNGIVCCSGSLACLTALQHLSLTAFPYEFNSSVIWEAGSGPLPASLTSLCLGGEHMVDVLPPQVGLLSNLQHLVLLRGLLDDEDDTAAAAPLAQLRSLTALRMSGFGSRLPTCLDRMTQLRSLHLARPPGDELFSSAEAELLHEALPALQQLTHLGLELVLPSPPSSLTCLRQLRSFGFLSYEAQEEHAGDPGQLPAGPWLACLRRLAGTCTLLAASLPALEAASQLRELSMLRVVGSEQQAALSILQWAAGHPAIRRVWLDSSLDRSGSVRRAAEEVARQTPQLALEGLQPEQRDMPFDEYDWQAVFPDVPLVPCCPQ